MSNAPVVLVTGASRGIGAATAEEFARRGYCVTLVARGADALEAVAGQVRDAGREALVCAGDLADLEFAESAVEQTLSRWGRVDVLVNNAAWRELVSMRTISLESWERTLRVCLTTPAFLARWVAKSMEARRKGVILNISSIMSSKAGGVSPAYVASKGALDSLTYELACLYGRSGVRVVGVNPGAIDTELSGDYTDTEGANLTQQIQQWSNDHIPLGRWGTPDEVARLLAALASDDASYLTGTTITLDGGWLQNHFPETLRRQIAPD